ncbi:MAG TPA: ribonuclease H-like domain-containing protein [Candidatus Paceibacterota bacterium]|nr:ribonuclease H-like domain-containing protein [Candidatus Paceibacterota bacterium]
MREITFDIETANILPTMARQDVTRLDLAVVAIHDSETGEFSSYSQEELPKLWPILEKADTLIGFNSDSFDIPLLNKYYPGDLTQIRSIDLLVEVQKSLGRRIRLQSLAEATLKVGKSGDGLQSVRWWQEGLHDKVREYCIMDVRITRQLYDYALKNGALKFKDLNQARDLKIDTSKWQEVPEAPAFTHTLGL